MARASYHLHDYRILFVFGESVEEAEALSCAELEIGDTVAAVRHGQGLGHFFERRDDGDPDGGVS
jgi:hypothetical protein